MITGCLELHQEIELESATRGSFKIEAKILEAVAKAAELQPEYSTYLDPVKGAATFKDKGVRIRKYRVYKDDGYRVVKIMGDIDDFTKVISSACLGDITLGKEGDNNRLVFALKPGAGDGKAPESKEAYKGVKIRLSVETPEAVVATSGKKTGKREVEWQFDADKDPSFLEAPSKLFVDYK